MKKHILVLGIGGTGTVAVQQALKNHPNCALPIVFDMDCAALERIALPHKMDLSSVDSFGSVLKQTDYKASGFDFLGDTRATRIDGALGGSMNSGSGTWRAKALLAFLAFCKDPDKKAALDQAIDLLFENVDENDRFELLSVASLTGGTGSGLLVPLTLYVKRRIKEAHGITIPSYALLACPGVHTVAMSGLTRSMAEANAYAALRELNAINLAASGDNRNDRPDSPARFTIGSEKDPVVGLLFDSHDPAFATPEHAPFEKVYLYERIPGSDSITYQTSVLSDLLLSLCHADWNHTLRNSDSDHNAIYYGISASCLDAGADHLAEYIVSKRLLDAILTEWSPLADAVARERQLAHLLKDSLSADDLALSAIRAGEELAPQQNRSYAEEINMDPREIFDKIEALTFDKASAIMRSLKSPLYPLDDKQLRESEKCDIMLDNAVALAQGLTRLAAKDFQTVSKEQQSLISSAIKTAFSLDGHFLRPDVALIRLYKLQCALRQKIDETSAKPVSKSTVLLLDQPECPKNSLYGRLGSTRFQRLSCAGSASDRLVRSACKAEDLVRKDASTLLQKILLGNCRIVYENLLAALERCSQFCETFFAELPTRSARLSEESAQLLNCVGKALPGRADLFSSENYQTAYLAYRNSENGKVEFYDLVGKALFTAFQKGDNAAKSFETIQSALRSSLYKTGRFDCNIFDLLEAYKEHDDAEALVKRVFRLAGSSLRFSLAKTTRTSGYTNRARSVLFLSKGIDDAENKLAAFGIPECETIASDHMGQNLLVVCETSGFCLSDLDEFSEEPKEATCYRSYQQMLERAQRYQTALYNPHILGRIDKIENLPKISPREQKEADRSVVRALMFLFMSGTISSRHEPEQGEIFFVGEEGKAPHPITFDESFVLADNFVLLLSWLRRNPDAVARWSNAFSNLVNKQLAALPGYVSGSFGFDALLGAIDSSRVIRFLKNEWFAQTTFAKKAASEGLCSFAYDLHLAENAQGGRNDAEALLLEGYETLLRFCTHRIKDEGTPEGTLLTEKELKEFQKHLRSAGKNRPGISEWMHACGAFLSTDKASKLLP